MGAGYTGTEVAAQGPLLTDALAQTHRSLRRQRMRWMLLDLAPRVLPELDQRLSRTADRVLRERGVEVRTGQSIAEADADGVRLTTGEQVPTRTLVWCVGVRPDPLVEQVGLPTEKGWLVVDQYLAVPGHPEVLACGDAAAVPDLTRFANWPGRTMKYLPGSSGRSRPMKISIALGVPEQFGVERLELVLGWSMGAEQTYEWAVRFPDMVRRALPGQVTAMTAQHAARQGTLAGRNIAASLGHGTRGAIATTTWASSSSSAGAMRQRTRCTYRCPGSRPRRGR